jgi:uncharacterized protein (DUF1810 family)
MMADLNRFIEAQQSNFEIALSEIRAGRKQSHWIWYIFPQLRGLGHSYNADLYGLEDLAETSAYFSHPTLGPRLVEISQALLGLPGKNATAVMGSPDDLKLRSCMTLFSLVPSADPVFRQVLEKYFRGQGDGKTIALLEQHG